MTDEGPRILHAARDCGRGEKARGIRNWSRWAAEGVTGRSHACRNRLLPEQRGGNYSSAAIGRRGPAPGPPSSRGDSMTSWPRRLSIVFASLSLLPVQPEVTRAQAPAFITAWGNRGTGDAQFLAPVGVAVDASGNVYVCDSNINRVQKFSSNGAYLSQWGTSGQGNGQFNGPAGLAVSRAGNIYVADTGA